MAIEISLDIKYRYPVVTNVYIVTNFIINNPIEKEVNICLDTNILISITGSAAITANIIYINHVII
jgi:hypothetical protein